MPLHLYVTHENSTNAITNSLTGLATNAQNFQTAGYKPLTYRFQSLFNAANNVLGGHFGAGGIAGRTSPTGVSLVPVGYDFSQGPIQSGQALNAAVQGKGFFVLQSENSNFLMTRASDFVFAADGSLRDLFNRRVMGYRVKNGVTDKSKLVPITLDPSIHDLTDVGFEINGKLTTNFQARKAVLDGDSTNTDNLPDGEVLFDLALARVANPSQMDKKPGEVFSTNLRSGEITAFGTSLDDKFGQIIGGSLEGSIVNPAETQIKALQDQRHYNLNQAMIGMTNTILTKLMDVIK